MFKKVLLTGCFMAFVGGHAFSSCSAPQNLIEAENCNPGANNWIVNSIDSTIQGFATDISYNVGQTVNFKINTSASNYQITIFRMGYYQGSGARQIATVTPSAKLPQS
jgi:predicted Zn-dependent protease